MTQEKHAQCARCNRALKDPKSIDRGMGPKCWSESGGGIFAPDLDADDKEWARREEALRAGEEIDVGANWDYPDPGNIIRGYYMRVSVRYKDGSFEAYGHLTKAGQPCQEVVFARGDIKAAYKAAVEAGPRYTAMAHRMRKQAGRKARKHMRKAG